MLAASLCVAILIIATLDGAAAAKKKGKGKKKVEAVHPLKCGVCVAAVEQITDEVCGELKRGSRKASVLDPHCALVFNESPCCLFGMRYLYAHVQVRKKENDTTTLDLRWGLTAEVKEGKARRLGKVGCIC